METITYTERYGKCYGKVMASSKGMKSGRDWKHYGKVTEILKTWKSGRDWMHYGKGL